ncbi:MAG TPA: FAD-binding oxidoreductase [Alphaproteobacteria bacterium]|nr:FAD-binding oxidoreductase [Alphaproteobacteria bacterium]
MVRHSAVQKLKDTLGPDIIRLPGEFDVARHMKDFTNEAPASLQLLGAAFPRTTEQVSDILKLCNEYGVPVQPQGGMTGLAGGGVPSVPSLILSLERFRAIEEVDTAAATITVQAGVPLEMVQNAADAAGFLFPLDLGGRGTAQVGGNASTNAGGNRVLRYGMMRDLVLGVEAVLADGTIIRSLNKMIKNNAGYDIKQLFLGTEGTLGVITRLVLRMFPKPKSVCTGLVALDNYEAVLDLLNRCKSGFGPTLSAFEIMWPEFYRTGTVALSRTPPLKEGYNIYVLTEMLGFDPDNDQDRFETVIGEAMEAGIVKDAVIAKSSKETQSLWAIRDCPGEFTRAGWWPQISFDVSIPVGDIGRFMSECDARIKKRWHGLRSMYFGHIADSNLHLSVKEDLSLFTAHELDEEVYALVGEFKGSVSAEHGIGSLKREFLHHSRSGAELELMRLLKATLDPKNILNPGKVI